MRRRTSHELEPLVRPRGGALAIDAVFVQHLCHDFGEADLPGPVSADARLRRRGDARQHERRAPRSTQRSTRPRRRLPGVAASTCGCRGSGRGRTAPGTPGPHAVRLAVARRLRQLSGLAMPCCMVGTPDRASFGNMAEEGRRARSGAATAYAAFRARLDSAEPPAVCRSCAHLQPARSDLAVRRCSRSD